MDKIDNDKTSINANPAGILEIEEFKNRTAKLRGEKQRKKSNKKNKH